MSSMNWMGVCSGTVALFAVSSAQADSYSTYRQTDYVTVQDFSRFQAIWTKAQTQNVRLALFGDSQETSPGGAGAVYMPRLNYEFFNTYGKVGETPIAPGYASYGGGSPPAEWLTRGGIGSATNTSSTNLAASQMLPGTSAGIFKSNAYGQLTMLSPTNDDVAAGTNLRGIPVWDKTKPLQATIFARQFSGSDEIAWSAAPQNSNTPSYFTTSTASGTTSAGLNNAAGGIVSATTGLLPWNGKNYQQLIVKGSGANGADILGVRFFSPEVTGGVSVQDFAAGGYRTDSFLANHTAASPMLAAMGPWDAIVIHTGANDAYGGVTPDQFKANLTALISAIRGENWLNNPNQKFILITDPYRSNQSGGMNAATYAAYSANYDQYAGVLAALANSDPNIMAINSRRLTEDWGWDATGYTPYLSDGVHYTDLGARTMANADFTLMFNGAVPEPSALSVVMLLAPAALRRRRR